jgi:hypothetical protein
MNPNEDRNLVFFAKYEYLFSPMQHITIDGDPGKTVEPRVRTSQTPGTLIMKCNLSKNKIYL